MAKVIWAPSALDDIESIAAYIAKDSVEMASLFVSRLFDATDRLQEFPFSDRMIPEINNPFQIYFIVKKNERIHPDGLQPSLIRIFITYP